MIKVKKITIGGGRKAKGKKKATPSANARPTKVRPATATEIKAARVSLGMLQRELAEFLGVAKRTVERWEVGEREPPNATLMLLKIEVERRGKSPASTA